MTLKEELAQEKAKNEALASALKDADEKLSKPVEELDQAKTTLSNAEKTIVDLNAEIKKAADDKKDDKKNDEDDEDEEDDEDDDKKDGKGKSKKAKAELVTRVETAEFNLKSANARIKELEADKISVEQAAEQKAREIAARNGGNLPARQPRAGDQTTEKDPKTGTWRERLSAFWKPIDIANP